MNTRPDAILLRFPEYSEMIRKRMHEDEEFECLCSDYEQCINMLRSLENETRQFHSRLEQYIEIKVELEQELLKYMF